MQKKAPGQNYVCLGAYFAKRKLSCVFYDACFAYHCDFYSSWICEICLNLLCNVLCKVLDFIVCNLLVVYEDAEFAA